MSIVPTGRNWKREGSYDGAISSRPGPALGPILSGEVMGHGLFRMSPKDVPALRRRPGPIPEGWGRVPPSLLRYSDEQTIAGDCGGVYGDREYGL